MLEGHTWCCFLFVDKMPDVQSLPDYVPFVKLKRMDYNNDEVGLAVPLY